VKYSVAELDAMPVGTCLACMGDEINDDWFYIKVRRGAKVVDATGLGWKAVSSTGMASSTFYTTVDMESGDYTHRADPYPIKEQAHGTE
jgi:hypothetical protein